MEGMKGQPRSRAKFIGEGIVIELVEYPDGSTSILRDGQTIGLWEPSERDDCLRAFMKMGTSRETLDAVVLLPPGEISKLTGSTAGASAVAAAAAVVAARARLEEQEKEQDRRRYLN